VGIPADYPSAEKLASTHEGKFLFEKWFVRALGGQPYRSSGGDTPSVMPSLQCRSCHTNLEERPSGETCTKCHKPAYASVFTSWQKGIGAKADEVAGLLAEVKAIKSELDGITVNGENALTLYENARANHAFVMTDTTYGAHNQKYSNALLSKSAEDLNKILEAAAK